MTRRFLLLAVVALSLCAACADSGPVDPATPDVVGAWQPLPDGWDGDVQTYERVDVLDGARSGIEFRADGTAAERTAGWCGTPPLSFFNVEGVWSAESDDVVLTDIDLGWMSPVSRWEIVEVSDTSLSFRRTWPEDER